MGPAIVFFALLFAVMLLDGIFRITKTNWYKIVGIMLLIMIAGVFASELILRNQ